MRLEATKYAFKVYIDSYSVVKHFTTQVLLFIFTQSNCLKKKKEKIEVSQCVQKTNHHNNIVCKKKKATKFCIA